MLVSQKLLVNKTNLFEASCSKGELPQLEQGEILFKISEFAFTANNVTYAVCGFNLNYWDFFPAEEPNGIIPVWGYAEVHESKHDDIGIGAKYYGFFPSAEYLIVKPGNLNAFGFSDISAHRKTLSPIYNYYSNVVKDPTYKGKNGKLIPIVKPLFATSFLIYHYLKEQNYFDAEQIILTSASSKTALALAFMMKQHDPSIKVIGLTADKNVGFVESSNYYSEVVSYKNSDQKLDAINTTLVDFAGNVDLLKSINEIFGEHLSHITLVGVTDWQSEKSFKELSNAKFFFAPTHIQEKYKTWGAEKTNQLLNQSLVAFIQDIQTQIELEYITKFDQLAELYLSMLKGDMDPQKGYIFKT